MVLPGDADPVKGLYYGCLLRCTCPLSSPHPPTPAADALPSKTMGDRGIIESNPIIARKYREMKKKIHLRKMRNMKSSLDTSLPRGLKIKNRKLVRKRNLKREQQTEEWLTAVERENRRLLEKMSLVMLGKDQDTNAQGRYKLAAKYRHFSTANGPARAKEQKRIDHGNEINAARINSTGPFYDTEVALKERVKMEAKIKYMCTFDAPLLKSSAKLKVVRKGDKLKRKKKANKSKKKTAGGQRMSKSESLMKPLRGERYEM